MERTRGIPKAVIEELKLGFPQSEAKKVKFIKEGHQARMPIPRALRQMIDFEKYPYCELEYNPEQKIIICKLKTK